MAMVPPWVLCLLKVQLLLSSPGSLIDEVRLRHLEAATLAEELLLCDSEPQSVLVTITAICLFIPAPLIVVTNSQAVSLFVSVCGEREHIKKKKKSSIKS
jgi:hypothetical protein